MGLRIRNLQSISDVQVNASITASLSALPWTLVPYSAANFSQSNGTWTVLSPAVLSFQFFKIGHFVDFNISLQGTTVAGGPISNLQINLPFTVLSRVLVLGLVTNGGGTQVVEGIIIAGTTRLLILDLPGAGFPDGNTNVGFQFAVQV